MIPRSCIRRAATAAFSTWCTSKSASFNLYIYGSKYSVDISIYVEDPRSLSGAGLPEGDITITKWVTLTQLPVLSGAQRRRRSPLGAQGERQLRDRPAGDALPNIYIHVSKFPSRYIDL